MDTGIKGKRAVVLAASSGLGRAIACELAAEGARVMICGRDEERLQEAAQEVERVGSGSEVRTQVTDVSEPESLNSLFEAVESAFGGLDLLVCNAGGPPPGTFDAVGEDSWERAFQLTLMSVVRSVHAARPLMRDAEGASILVVGSSSVKRPIPNLLLSNVFRPAVNALVNDISADLAGEGIRINMLCPGRIQTERINQLDQARAEREGKSFEEIRNAGVANIPMRRLGEPEEFARAAVFLLGTGASYITGSTLLVDGGSVRAM
jgi:3-oxoacyl-[acyl-carrier protein] reductase